MKAVVGIGRLLQDVLGHDEGFGEERQIGRVGLLHPPGDLGRRDHGDVAHQRMAGGAPGAEIGVDDQLERELDVLGGEGRAVMPGDVVAQVDLPGETVLGNAAIILARNLEARSAG